MRFTNDITNAIIYISRFLISPTNGKSQKRFLRILAKPRVNFHREEGTYVEIEGSITKSMFGPLEIPSYSLELTKDVDLIDEIINLKGDRVKINHIEYEKMDAVMRLMNLKVLLQREDLLTARIKMLEEAIKNNWWDDVKVILESLNIPLDIEVFLLTAIVYKITKGHPRKKIREIVQNLYSSNYKLLWLMEHEFVRYIKAIPPMKRARLKYSPRIKERLIGLVWSSVSNKASQERRSFEEY